MRITFIGDVHGFIDRYQKMLRRLGPCTFQVGDMGVGFANHRGEISPNGGLHADIMNSGDHKWIRGNHDNPAIARALTGRGYAGDYGYREDIGLFWMGGAFSIDYRMRVPGRNWWPDEELSYQEIAAAVDLYEAKKPKFVVSHEAPTRVAEYLLTVIAPNFRNEKIECIGTRTAAGLQCMLDIHRPKEWVFGHYHIDHSFVWKDTKFTCVNGVLPDEGKALPSTYTITDEPLIVVP